MEFNELVNNRYSCRKYSAQPVDREKIVTCIDAARLAPSACNAQPWKFIVVDDPVLKTQLVSVATAGIYQPTKFIHHAPVIIIVVADKPTFLSHVGSQVRRLNFYLLDIGIACQNLILQATELGLGTCYIGWFNEPEVKKLLHVPRSLSIPLLISLGYPSPQETKVSPTVPSYTRTKPMLRKPITDILTFNPDV